MNDRQAAHADLVTGVVLFALSVAVLVGAWNMDRLELRRIHPFSAPGVTPGLLAIALALTSILLIVQAWRRRGAEGWRLSPGTVGGWFGDGTRRLLLAAGLCLIYALGLVGRMPFWLATTLFVAAFVAAFEWRGEGSRLIRLTWAVGIGVACGLVVSYVFSELFLVRLP